MTRAARIAARGAILALAVALAAKVTLDGLATRLMASDPVLAARLSPGNGEVAIAAAARLAGSHSGTRDPKVRRLVTAALARSAADPAAIEFRALEAGADGDPRRETVLFHLSDAISRRSLATRLWLIQDAVQRGDTGNALANFDIALRTSTDAPATLFPILAGATSDPTLSAPLAHLFDRPSDWRALFFHYALTEVQTDDGLVRVVPLMRDRAWLVASGVADALVGNLVADRQFADARRIYDLFSHDREAGALVRDRAFADPGAAFPFGWEFTQRGEIGAERSLVHGRPALAYQALPGDDGVVASQLLMLLPGRYRLSTRAAVTATDRNAPPYWTITCAGRGGGQVALLDAPVDGNEVTKTAFVVPAGCLAQWLVLALRGSDKPGGQSGALAAVTVMSSSDRAGTGRPA
jgi:hypothetical protein